jgi:hypothetical protein
MPHPQLLWLLTETNSQLFPFSSKVPSHLCHSSNECPCSSILEFLLLADRPLRTSSPLKEAVCLQHPCTHLQGVSREQGAVCWLHGLFPGMLHQVTLTDPTDKGWAYFSKKEWLPRLSAALLWCSFLGVQAYTMLPFKSAPWQLGGHRPLVQILCWHYHK